MNRNYTAIFLFGGHLVTVTGRYHKGCPETYYEPAEEPYFSPVSVEVSGEDILNSIESVLEIKDFYEDFWLEAERELWASNEDIITGNDPF